MKFNVKKTAKVIGKFIKTNRDPLINGGSTLLLLAGTVLTGFATVKATKKIEKIKSEREEPLTNKEIVKEVYKDYIPAAAVTVLGTAGSIWSNVKLAKECAGLTTAYALADKALADYKEAATEVLTDKQETELHRKAVEKNMKNADIEKAECTKSGDTLCYDNLSGRYFYADIDAIKNAINEFNSIALTNGRNNDEATLLNELYYLINLRPCALGNQFGWSVKSTDDFIRLREGCMNEETTGKPVYIVDFWNPPCYINEYGNIEIPRRGGYGI